MNLSVVIPVYNSATLLEQLVQRLLPVLDGTGLSYEVVFVDDGSRDDSWRVLTELKAAHPDKITAIQLMRNFGQHNALMCGLRHTQGKYVVTMDDDLQNPPEEIPRLLEAIESRGLDLVYGSAKCPSRSFARCTASWLVNDLFFKVVFRSRAHVSPFRIMRRELLQSVFSYTLNFTYLDGLLAWNTQRIADIPVEHHPRGAGKSGYSLSKLVVLALNLFTNFSLLPLQLVSLAGLVAAGLGLIVGTYCLVQYLMANISVPGYASIIISVLVLGGMQLLSLGMMGEYLGRLHLNVNRKPQYAIRASLTAQRSEDHGELPLADEQNNSVPLDQEPIRPVAEATHVRWN